MTHEETHGNQTIQMSPVSSLLLSVGPPGSTHEETLDFLLSLTGPAHSAHSAHSAHTGCSVLCTHNTLQPVCALCALCALCAGPVSDRRKSSVSSCVEPGGPTERRSDDTGDI